MGNHDPAYFTEETFRFLAELAAQNERAFFEAHKPHYEAHVREPARALIRAMRPHLEALSPELLADDRRQGGSLLRIHRDVRFSADKSPYKTHIGIQFRHRAGKDIHAPGLYVHIEPDSHFLGAGMWRPDGASLAVIRAQIDAQQGRWREIIGALTRRGVWRLGGESLKRAPRGFPADHPLVDDLKRKSFILDTPLEATSVLSPGLPALLADRFGETRDLLRFLCDAIDVSF